MDASSCVGEQANGILNPANLATGQVLWVPRTHPIQWVCCFMKEKQKATLKSRISVCGLSEGLCLWLHFL